jgi:hypothetical protein
MGTAWLSNFSDDDQRTAKKLVDSLYVVSSSTFERELTDYIKVQLELDEIRRPAVLLSVKRVGHHDVMFEPLDKARSRRTRDAVLTPTISNEESDAGSEFRVQNLLRNIRNRFPGHDVLDGAASVDFLRDRRIRSLVYVTDYAGSGAEAVKYAAAWVRNRHIRSWRSFRYTRIHLIMFAASPAAMSAVRQCGFVDDVWPVHYAADFASAEWSEDERKNVIDLCERYAGRSAGSLGYSGSAGLFVMQHTVPNNLPRILWQIRGPRAKTGTAWSSLFPRRIFPVQLQKELVDYRPEHNIVHVLRDIGRPELARARMIRGLDRDALDVMLTLLAMIAGGRRAPEQLAVATRLAARDIDIALDVAKSWGVIDNKVRLTDEGWAELRAAGRPPRHVTFELQGSDEVYYPMQLRGSR